MKAQGRGLCGREYQLWFGAFARIGPDASRCCEVAAFLDTRPARMLHPRSSGILKTSETQPPADGSWRGHAILVVNVETTELTLPSRIEAVNEAAASVAGLLSRMGVGEEAAFGIDMAVREAVTNAVLHGNKQDQSKSVQVTLKTLPDKIEIDVHDQGTGFNPAAVPDPTAEENIIDRKSTRLNSSHSAKSRMPSSA